MPKSFFFPLNSFSVPFCSLLFRSSRCRRCQNDTWALWEWWAHLVWDGGRVSICPNCSRPHLAWPELTLGKRETNSWTRKFKPYRILLHVEGITVCSLVKLPSPFIHFSLESFMHVFFLPNSVTSFSFSKSLTYSVGSSMRGRSKSVLLPWYP